MSDLIGIFASAVDLNEITTNLVPYPKLHFLVSSMAPHSAFSHSGMNQYLSSS